jgi:hypothetical protein
MPSNDSRRVADFHSLRHTFITNLAASGITLTLDRYTHVG